MRENEMVEKTLDNGIEMSASDLFSDYLHKNDLLEPGSNYFLMFGPGHYVGHNQVSYELRRCSEGGEEGDEQRKLATCCS